MNLFTGMTSNQILSVLFMGALFTGFALLEAAALAAFYVASKPRHGRVRTGAVWHFIAALVLMMCFVATVWAAPAEGSFVNNDQMFTGDRFGKVLWGVGFAVVGLFFMVVGALVSGKQRREIAQQALESDPLWRMAGADSFVPTSIDDVVYR